MIKNHIYELSKLTFHRMCWFILLQLILYSQHTRCIGEGLWQKYLLTIIYYFA
jgi:hypothetical protein